MSNPQIFIDYNTVLGLLQAFEKPHTKQIPPTALDLWQIKYHPARLNDPSPAYTSIGAKKLIKSTIRKLEQLNQHQADILKRRFTADNVANGRKVAEELGITERQLRERQRNAVKLLTQLLNKEEGHFRKMHLKQMALGLGRKPYDTLFGVDRFVKAFLDQLVHDPKRLIFVLTGIGGIGKTSLAHQIADEAVRSGSFPRAEMLFIEGGAIDPDQLIRRLGRKIFKYGRDGNVEPGLAEIENRLLRLFSVSKQLIWIDGIEEGLDSVLDVLRPLAGETRFLITSRPTPMRQSGFAYVQMVPELTVAQAFALIEYELANVHRHNPLSVGLSKEAFNTIYSTVGGNPLALQLIAGLTSNMTISQVLSELKLVNQGDTAELYQRIYARIWQYLEQLGRNVLICLALFKENQVTHETLLRLNHSPTNGESSLSEAKLQEILTYLRQRSLIEVSGGLHDQEYRFGIHNLTRAFLNSAVIAWPSALQPSKNSSEWTYSPIQFIEQGIKAWLAHADGIDDRTRQEDEVLQDLNAISEVIDLALYWSETRLDAVELLQRVWSLLQRHGYFETLEPQLEKAIEFLEKDGADLVTVVRLKNRMGQIWRIRGDKQKALDWHKQLKMQAIEINDARLMGETEFQLSEGFYAVGDLENALSSAQIGLKLFSQSTPAFRWTSAIENTIGLISFDKREFEKSFFHFDKSAKQSELIEDYAEQARSLRNAGRALVSLKQFDQARSFYSKSLALYSNNLLEKSELWHDIGFLELESRQYLAAIKHFELADNVVLRRSKRDLLYSGLLHNIGLAYLRLEQYGQAIKYLESAVNLRNELQKSLLAAKSMGLLAEAYWRSHQFAKAVPVYDLSIRILEDRPEEADLVAELRQERDDAKKNLSKIE